MGRKCAVPHCYTGYRQCTDKASLYKVPDDDFFLTKWQEAIAREDRPINPKDYVCEKHFKEDDILRKRIRKDIVEDYQRPKLKPDAIPSVFPDLPEFILKMTKKRRKMTAETSPSNKIVDISTDSNGNETSSEIKIEPEISTHIEQENILHNGINNDEINIKTEIDDPPSPCNEELEEFDASGAKLYHCDECSYKTKFSHNLRTHKVKHLSGDDAFMFCELCVNYKTKWEITYLNHMKKKHGVILKDFLKCPFCPFRTKNKTFLSKHCDKEHGGADAVDEIKFKCEHEGCDYESDSKALLNIHNLTHDKPKPQETNTIVFSCKECYFKSSSRRSLTTHIKSTHSEGTNTQPSHRLSESSINNRTDKPNIEESNKLKSFSCKECYFTTHFKGSLKTHIKSAHSDGVNIGFMKRPLKSSIDIPETNGTDTTNKPNVKDNSNDGGNPKRLLKVGADKSELNAMPNTTRLLIKKSNIRARPSFPCSRCPYKAHSQLLLDKHLMKHEMASNKIPLSCRKCSFTTYSEESFEIHQTETFHCIECPYSTNDKSESIKHILIHRNTTLEVIYPNASQNDLEDATESEEREMMATNFCMVTIKEEPTND